MIKVFSPNMLKTFDECQMKFYLRYIKNISVPMQKSFFERGKKIHALASYYLRGFNVDKMEKSLSQDELALWETLKTNPYMSKEVVATEYTLSVRVKDHWVGGRIDALVRDGDDFIILDYKTGSIPKNPENDFQTLVYLLAVSKKFPKFNTLRFVYIDLKHKIECSIEFNPNSVLRIEEICAKIDFMMKSAVFEKTCHKCEYEKLCGE